MKKLNWEAFKNYCSRTGKKESHYQSILDFQSEQVFVDDLGEYYFDSLDDVIWSDYYGSYVVKDIDVLILEELK